MFSEREQNLTLSPKIALKQKTPVIRPSFVKVPLLIQGSSVVTEVVVEEDLPSSVLLISLLFSLILEMLISVFPKFARKFTRSSSIMHNTLSNFKFTLQLLTREQFV